ncbi:hypothetical protein LguiA_015243 [Lonicera macranthoides]
MALKNKALLLILTFSLLLSYSIEAAPAPSPDGNSEATLAPSPAVDENRKNFIAEKVKEAIPKAEDFLQKIKKRLDETPGSSPAEQCLKSCMGTYENIIIDMKATVETLSLKTAYDFDLKMTGLKAELDKCELCNAEVSKEDPEIKNYNEWFNGVTVEILNELGKYNS